MSVKKSAQSKVSTQADRHDCCFSEQCGVGTLQKKYVEEFGRKIIWTLFGMVLVYLIVFLGTLIQKNLKETHFVGRSDDIERTITINASAQVTAKPDVAFTTMGVQSVGLTVADAQQQNTQIMNALISGLSVLGIDDDDIQTTHYNVYPDHDYLPDEGQVLRGYQVDQSVRIKIRDVSVANQVLALAGEIGANNVGGLDFTIDDPDVYISQAREKAVTKIRNQAAELTTMLGVQIVGIVSYDEFESGAADVYPQPYAVRSLEYGGAELPQIESGSQDVVVNVNVIFEIE